MATISAQVRHHHVEHAVITPTNTRCFVCIESDGIVGNFSARQQPAVNDCAPQRIS
jgi:hypothetical protein